MGKTIGHHTSFSDILLYVNPQSCPYVIVAICRKRLWQNAHTHGNTRYAICLSGKSVFFVGKVCIFLCGENPDKIVDFCREALTHVNTVVRAGGLKDAGWLDAGWWQLHRCNSGAVDAYQKVTSMLFIAKAALR